MKLTYAYVTLKSYKKGGDIEMNRAFDLDDTLINTGETLAEMLVKSGIELRKPREPYLSLRLAKENGEVSEDDYEFLINTASDLAKPYPGMVALMRDTIREYGEVHVVSTRSYFNTETTLNILGRVLEERYLYRVKIHWCKNLSGELSGHGDAKVATWHKLVNEGVNIFVDDLGFNIRAILDKMYPRLRPEMVMQPWSLDRLYCGEVNTDDRVTLVYPV
jgi:hypothetical protein